MHADVRTTGVLCALLGLAQGFYIPGISFKSYRLGETLPLLVNKVYSDNSELQYAYAELPFVCPPTGRVRAGRFTSGASLSLNLGEVLRGDRITVSDYELLMGTDDEAHFLCSKIVDGAGIKRTRELIRDGYVAEWIVDNLPGATSFKSTDQKSKYYAAGFKIGEEVVSSPGAPPQYFLYNHVTLVIRYHRAPGNDGEQGKQVVVGFEVYPKSIGAGNRNKDGIPEDINHPQNGLELVTSSNSTISADESDGGSLAIPFTYSVYFREVAGIDWKNRWDLYFVAQDSSTNIHWFAIVNSMVIAALLSTVVAVILARTIRGDLTDDSKIKMKKLKSPSKNGERTGGLLTQLDDVEEEAGIDSDDEGIEELTGWKLVHGDVFRTPRYGELLAPLVGSGVQLLLMATGLVSLSAFGVLNPSFRGGYISVGTAFFIIAGVFSGYFSSRVYKTFGGQLWEKNVFVTASLMPGLLFSIVFILNLFVWAQASSTAIPFGTLLGLVCLWLFIQLPLVYLGGRYGYKTVGAYTHPLKANAIPRQIPVQSWGTKSFQAILLSGLVPFLVVFIELMFVFKSLWQDKSGYYYVFGFTAVVGIILTITVVEVTIVATYIQLCAENYHWWWQSFLVGGSSSVWIYAYLLWYYFTKLHITGFVSSLLFFAYGFLACAVYGLLMGTVGFLAAYTFVRRIYGAIKVD
ncbi:hypothetical protein BDV96DRAFT_525670 [Lophiotrema nucula]|uniref:Transmembrane 9 superfamily member n=1 Tax=Lophiotrema nucula TaxID=690887 RepID=A0A6A5YYG5_9PLEO|nr:hypothetical protein BDV96DRAFT_525670 [Lophiotrema nucula]